MQLGKKVFLLLVLINLLNIKTNNLIIDKEIQGFYISSGKDDFKKLRYDVLKTIVYTYVEIDKNGSLIPSDNYNPLPLISYAHNRKVKVVLMFLGKDDISKDILLENKSIQNKAINNLLEEVKKNNFDGVDIDLEGINTTNSISLQSNKKLATEFVKSLSYVFRSNNPNYRISIDISLYANQIFNLTEIQNKVDYINLMSYDRYGPWSDNAGPNAPINLDNGDGLFDNVKYYKGLVNKTKLLIIIPWYGYEFTTESDERLSKINGNVKYIPYNEYINYINKYNIKWDPIWQSPWYVRQDNTTNRWYQGHYENIESLSIKYDIVNSEELAGIGIWSVNFGIDRIDLWKLIKHKFGRYLCCA